jgi:hypothetical protein
MGVQWSLTAVEMGDQRMGVIVARLMTGDLLEARNRAEMFSVGDLFSRWVAALGQVVTLTTLRESGLIVKPSGLTDVIVAETLRLRTRLSTFARPASKVALADLLQRFVLLGPRCTPDGDLTEDPADFYAQVILALATQDLRAVLAREVGVVRAVLVGAAPLPKLLEHGKPQPVARKWFLTMPFTHLVPAADLPVYLRETALYLRLHQANNKE